MFDVILSFDAAVLSGVCADYCMITEGSLYLYTLLPMFLVTLILQHNVAT